MGLETEKRRGAWLQQEGEEDEHFSVDSIPHHQQRQHTTSQHQDTAAWRPTGSSFHRSTTAKTMAQLTLTTPTKMDTITPHYQHKPHPILCHSFSGGDLCWGGACSRLFGRGAWFSWGGFSLFLFSWRSKTDVHFFFFSFSLSLFVGLGRYGWRGGYGYLLW